MVSAAVDAQSGSGDGDMHLILVAESGLLSRHGQRAASTTRADRVVHEVWASGPRGGLPDCKDADACGNSQHEGQKTTHEDDSSSARNPRHGSVVLALASTSAQPTTTMSPSTHRVNPDSADC